jgi:hypothetical protein
MRSYPPLLKPAQPSLASAQGKAFATVRLPGKFDPLGMISLRSEQSIQQLRGQKLAHQDGRETHRIMVS